MSAISYALKGATTLNMYIPTTDSHPTYLYRINWIILLDLQRNGTVRGTRSGIFCLDKLLCVSCIKMQANILCVQHRKRYTMLETAKLPVSQYQRYSSEIPIWALSRYIAGSLWLKSKYIIQIDYFFLGVSSAHCVLYACMLWMTR